MADSIPLLSNLASTDLPCNVDHSSKLDSLEDLIEPYIRGFTWSQAFQLMLISMASFFGAQQTFITIFTDAKPSWHCTQTSNDTITSCDSQSSICQLPVNSWQWDKPAHTSIVSEWSLLCAGNEIIAGLPASSFFIGCVLGGIILSILGDSLGRKKLLIISCLTMSTAALLIAFSSNIWMYTGLKILSGFGRAAIGSCVLVLSTESVGKKWRGQAGIVGFFFSTLGFISLPALAYLNRSNSWRTLYLLTSIPAILYCIIIQFCINESPKWLLEQGKIVEALVVLNRNHEYDPNCNNSSISLLVHSNNQDRVRQKVGNNHQSLISTLLKNKGILQQLILAMLVGFGIGVIFYGMPLAVGNLDFNLYLSVAFNALLQIPALAVTFCLAKSKRRISLLTLSTISGACGISSILVGNQRRGLQMLLELASFSSVDAAFNMLLIYTVELFPTNTRNSAVAMVRQAIMFGGAISPLVIAIGGDLDLNKILPNFIFGLLILILGSLVIFLPETMSETVSVKLDEKQQENDGTLTNVV